MNLDTYEAQQYIQERLQEKLDEFQKAMKVVADNTITDLYVELLPHAWSDTESNMSNRVKDTVENIIAGKFEIVDGHQDMFKVDDGAGCYNYFSVWEYGGIVKPIFEMFRDKIVSERIKQLESQVTYLKEQLHRNY